MMALALPFAYLHARAGGISLKVFGGIMLGISFVLLNNVASHLGLLRNWTPWIVAAAPSALYLLLSLAAFSWLVRYRMKRGLLLFAHGARDPRWALPFEDVAARMRRGRCVGARGAELPRVHVARAGRGRPCAGGCRAAPASRWCRCSSGPAAMCARTCRPCSTRCADAHPQVQWLLRPAIGEDDAVIAAMAAAALRPSRHTLSCVRWNNPTDQQIARTS